MTLKITKLSFHITSYHDIFYIKQHGKKSDFFINDLAYYIRHHLREFLLTTVASGLLGINIH